MATSAFKSTSRRSSIGASSSGADDSQSSSNKAHRRSRSLSRFSRGLPSEQDEPRADYAAPPRGKFVNTVRGSAFQEISLDDLALEFFSSKDNGSSNNNGEERGSGDRGRSRSSTRGSEIGRWASDTASSRRRGRSVSRNGGGHKGLVSNGNAGKAGNSAANTRRRRSVSVARSLISDSENEADLFQSSRSHSNVKNIEIWKSQTFSSQKKPSLGNQRLGKSVSHKDLMHLHDGYSSHSSALTDDEAKDALSGKNGIEKTIQEVFAQKRAEHPIEEVVSSGLYEAMRKELRSAVEDIRSELEQVMARNDAALANDGCLQPEKPDDPQVISAMRKSYATKLEQSQKRKQDLLAEMMAEEQRGRELSKIVRELLPDSKNSAVEQKPSRARKRSSDRNRMSRRLTEEAEKYFEDFISNVEDTDLSSFDGERSDGSSSLGVPIKSRNSTCGVIESFQSPAGSKPCPAGTDGVIFPWLQWETSNDGSLIGKNNLQTPVTPKTLQWDAEQDIALGQDPSAYSISSHGSWSPRITNGHSSTTKVDKGEKSKDSGIHRSACFDMSEYLMLKRKEEVLFERYKERRLIDSGGLLLCTNIF